MSRQLLTCDCGCGRKAYRNQLVEVTMEQAIDPSCRVTTAAKRFYVTRPCKEPFEDELGLMYLLEQLARAWTPEPRGRWWLINFWLNPLYPWPRVFRSYIRRIFAARKVLRMQHGIYERTRGFAYARDRATQSAIMFGAPRFIQGYLARRFKGRLERLEKARNEAIERAQTEIAAMPPPDSEAAPVQ